MKILFIAQGEGRGHLTQALTLEKMLRDQGHEVVEILVGKSKSREIPQFFLNRTKAPVFQFKSPNFLPSKENKRVGLARSIAYNLLKVHQYIASIHFIYQHIQRSGADLVVNFYEILGGLTYAICRPKIPEVCIGHQYLFLHPDFHFPDFHKKSQELMIAFTRLTCLGATRKLALSIRQYSNVDEKGLTVVPPLLRNEVKNASRHHGDTITGYILNAGFSDYVIKWHRQHPSVKLCFF